MMRSAVPRETFTWRWLTDRGLQIFAGDAVLPLYLRLKRAGLKEIAELVPADSSLLVVLTPGTQASPQLLDLLTHGDDEPPLIAPGRQHQIMVRFDGADLAEVAEKLSLTVGALVKGLCEIEFSVKFLGFQPGFAYLAGLPLAWQLPRREDPRTKVPAGSVALGGPYCGIYPVEGPGGWHLLGQTQVTLFDPSASPPALFQPGDSVRLVAL